MNCTMSNSCSDGCAVINGTETCFCTPGYQLDNDAITCSGVTHSYFNYNFTHVHI